MKMLVMAPKLNGHASEEHLEKYSMDTLEEEEIAAVEEHLLVCETCRRRLEQIEEWINAIRSAAVRIQREERAGDSGRWWLPVFRPLGLAFAAVLMLVIGAGIAVRVGVIAPGTAPIAVRMEAVRGSAFEAQAPSGKPLILQLDLTSLPVLPSYAAEMVDQGGALVWQGSARGSGQETSIRIPRQAAGMYFVRIYSPSGELLREFGLQVKP